MAKIASSVPRMNTTDVNLNLPTKNNFSRETLSLFETIGKSKKLANQVELQFASAFDDFKDMSSIVNITAGVSCSDIGITKESLR